MTAGWICAFNCEAFKPGTFLIETSAKHPNEKLKTLNTHTIAGMKYSIATFVKVSDMSAKMNIIATLFETACVVNPNVFKVDLTEIQKMFALIGTHEGNAPGRPIRDMSSVLYDGQAVIHEDTVKEHEWIGVYSAADNIIYHGIKEYTSPSRFAMAHYNATRGEERSANGWIECRVIVNGRCVILDHLPKKS